VFPYLPGPRGHEVAEAFCRREFDAVWDRLQDILAEEDAPRFRHLLGLMQYFSGDFAAADASLERAYSTLRQRGDGRGASLVAVSLGRLHHDGVGDQPVGLGWLARALSLVESEEPCVEQGWALLALTGCNVADTASLHANAERALGIARRLHDVELECKALADGGLALVSLGRVAEGMSWLDQAMVMLRSRECPSPIIVSQVVCDLMSACERVADLARAESWLQALERMGIVQPPDREPAFLFTHCRIAYGVVLCEIGRWTEAEVALQIGVSTGTTQGWSNQVASRAALADLMIHQRRLDAAAALLDGLGDRVEALSPIARLHLARGDHDLAAAVARQGLRLLGGDHTRAAGLLVVLADAEVARGDLEAAEVAASRLEEFAAEAELPVFGALAAQARAHIDRGRGDIAGAIHRLGEALGVLGGEGRPLLRGAIHLELAQLLAAQDRSAAIAEATAALAIYQRIDAPALRQAAELLESLGQRVSVQARTSGPLELLTPRERQVFDLLALGMSNPDIARRLFLSTRTAEHHVSSILDKLGLRSRVEAAAFAAALRMDRVEKRSYGESTLASA
jgi:DNA-binding CsgD family transcriptional regulator